VITTDVLSGGFFAGGEEPPDRAGAQVHCECMPAVPDGLDGSRRGIPVSVRGRLRLAGYLSRHPACDAGMCP